MGSIYDIIVITTTLGMLSVYSYNSDFRKNFPGRYAYEFSILPRKE